MRASVLVAQLQRQVREEGDQEVLILRAGERDTVHSVGTFSDLDTDEHYITLVTDAYFNAFDAGFRIGIESKCCPECETPNQSGALCHQCRRSIEKEARP